MSLDIAKYQKKLTNRIGRFSGRFMSDTKWTKLFRTLSQNSADINKCLIKDIWDDALRQIEIPSIQNFHNTFNDTGIKDVMDGGPMTFKEIEWIELPGQWIIDRNMRTQKLEPFKFQQDILKIKNVIDHVGQLAIELDSDKLIIYGYK